MRNAKVFAFVQNCGMLIENFDLNQSFAFPKNFVLSKKVPHSHTPIASLSQSVITYCHQKNPLRVCPKLHIHFCYAWSSQRFKSLPSILCEIVVVQSRLPDKSRSFSQNNVSTGDLNRGRRVKPRLLFGSFCRSKKNKPVSLSGAFHCMESMPLSGQHATRAMEFRGFANLESAHTSGGIAQAN